MSKFLTFEEDNEGWRKDVPFDISMRLQNEVPTPEPPSPRERVRTPTLARSETYNTAYGTRNPEYAARVRRRTAGTPSFRRIRPNVVTGADRLRASISATPSMPSGGGGYTGGGSSGGGY